MKRQPRVIFISYPHFAKEAPHLLEGKASIEWIDLADWRKMTLLQRLGRAVKADVVHYFVGRVKLLEILIFRCVGKRVVLHFVGTDLLSLQSSGSRKKREARIVQRFASVVADGQNLVDELSQLGIAAQLLPFVTSNVNEDRSSLYWENGPPWKFVSYIPAKARDFYGFDTVIEAARRFPVFEFLILHMKKEDCSQPLPPNVKLLGRVENVGEILKSCHALIRITEHDGMPMMVVEALSCGRYVVFSGTFPCCRQAGNIDEVVQSIEEVTRQSKCNMDGFDYVANNLSRNKLSELYMELYEDRCN